MNRGARYALALLCFAAGACVAIVDPPQLTEGCGEDAKACGDRCVSLRNPQTGCGSAECTPCNLDHATARCSAAGTCVKAACSANWEDCNEDGAEPGNDGCETDLAHNPDHCGACDNVCASLPNALPGCRAGECSIGRCESGFGDCDHDPETGCEVDVGNNPEHCGGCNEACAEGEICERGACVSLSTG